MKEGTYYRIFAPLYSHEKEDIMLIWMSYIMEDVYLRRTKIEDYCRNNRTDILSALFYIYSDIEYKYLCRNNPMDYNTGYRNFYESYYSFYTLKQHFEDFLRGENVEITEIQQNSINKMIEKLEKDLYYSNSEALKDGFIDFENAGISSISKYEVNSDCNYLSIIIKEMIDERRSDPTQFRDPIVLEEAIVIFMSDLEEQMYIPYDKTEDIESSKKEEKKQFLTKYTHDELKEIFINSMDKGLFKDDTRLEDFLYVFGGGDKPKDFNKLDWIITAKSKSVNKRLLIYYFMKIYNLKRDYVRSPFIQFINERVKAGDKIIELRSKADFEYISEELKGIFPE